MSDSIQQALASAIARLLQPLVRLLLRHGIAFDTFAEIAKRVYVKVAAEDFALDNRKPSQSRIAVLTGLTRKEVLRISRVDPDEDAAVTKHNRASRVISGWLHDSDFHDSRGHPASLDMDGAEKSFATLVTRYSGDMPVRAMADELLRVGAMNILKNGRLKLATTAYVPTETSTEALLILGNDVADLIDTIDYNIAPDTEGTRFQLKTSYDNISDDDAEIFTRWADPQSMKLIKQFDAWLAQHDRDNLIKNDDLAIKAAAKKTGGRNRIGVGIYLFREHLDDNGQRRKPRKTEDE